jgi:hypothetical protein
MPVNNVVAKVAVEVVAKNGADILITAATKTTNFTRPDAVAMALGKAIKEPFLEADNIPEGTKEIIARYDHLVTNTEIQTILKPRIGRVYTRAIVTPGLTTPVCASTSKARLPPSISILQANS